MNGLCFFTVLMLLRIVNTQVIISNTLHDDQFACPGTEVVFTCEVRAQVLSWTSEEVIGSGNDQLPFATTDTPGSESRKNSNVDPSTFAILIINELDNGVIRLVSELHVMVPSDRSEISVLCNDGITSMSTTKSFTILGQPNVPQDVFASQLQCMLQLNISTSTTRCPNTYFWRYSPMNATQAGVNDYDIFVNGVLESNHTVTNLTTNTGASVLSVFNVTKCDVYMFSVSAVNVCGCRGEMSSDLVLNPEERIQEICLFISGTAHQDYTLTTLLIAVFIAMNFDHA